MEIVLRVPADELEVFREGDVTLEDPGPHPGARFVGLFRVLGKLKGGAAVAYRKTGLPERPGGAALQLPLQPAVLHVLHEEEGARTELNRRFLFPVAAAIVL